MLQLPDFGVRVLSIACAISCGGALAAQGPPQLQWLGGGHIGNSGAALSPDGQTFATSGQDDETIKLWRTSDGTEIRTLAAHVAQVNAIAFSPDGQTLASGGEVAFGSGDVNVKIWRVSDGAILKTLDNGDFSGVNSVAFSPDGTLLAAGSGQNVKIWNIATGAVIHTLTGHSFTVFSVFVRSQRRGRPHAAAASASRTCRRSGPA